jgi:hypothetical protein
MVHRSPCSVENEVPDGQFRTWVERYVVTDEGVLVDSPNGGKDGFQEVDGEPRSKAINAFFVPKFCNHYENFGRPGPMKKTTPLGRS